MNDDRNLGLDRGGAKGVLFSFALLFLIFVPGTALLLFGRGNTLVLPGFVIEFLYPHTTPWPERALLAAFSEKVDAFGQVTFENFAAADVFVQQFFVLALLCSILVVALLTLQVCAGALFPFSHQLTPLGYLKAVAIVLLLRELQVCLLVGEAASAIRADPVYLMAKLVAPTLLVTMSCVLAAIIWLSALSIYRAVAAPVN